MTRGFGFWFLSSRTWFGISVWVLNHLGFKAPPCGRGSLLGEVGTVRTGMIEEWNGGKRCYVLRVTSLVNKGFSAQGVACSLKAL